MMTPDEFNLIVGFGCVLVTMIGGIVARDRYIQKQITDGDKEIRSESKSETDNLHQRINKIHDEFVKREDMTYNFNQIDRKLDNMQRGQDETNKRLDAVLLAINTKKSQ